MPETVDADALDLARLIRPGETVAWIGTTAEPVTLVRLLDAQADRIGPIGVFAGLGLGQELQPGHDSLAFTACGGAGTNRRFFERQAGGVVPAHYSDLPDLIAS